MDAALRKKPVRSATEQFEDLPLMLAVPSTRIADTPAPSVAGSETSEAAAAAVTATSKNDRQRAILACLARVPSPGVLSRYEIHVRTGIPISVLCARLSELESTHVECVAGACRSHEKPTLSVNGYRITAAGRALVCEVDPR